MNFIQSQITFIENFGSAYLKGALTTVELSIVGVIFGLILGTLIALMRLSKNKIIYFLSTAYVEIIRGTPLLIQLLIIYFGLKSLIPDSLEFLKNPMLLCSISISINSSAYIAEIIRGGINSVDRGQMEAARSLGLTKSQSMKKVILPQAVKNILPALVNEFITLIKESSITFTVGIAELTYRGRNLYTTSWQMRPLIYVAVVYFLMTFSLSKAMNVLERRLARD